MKKLWLWVPVMLIFWTGNHLLSLYGLAHLAGPWVIVVFGQGLRWPIWLLAFSYLLDLATALNMSSSKKVEKNEIAWGPTLVLYTWLVLSVVNAALVCWVAILFFYPAWGVAAFVALLYLFIRAAVFVFAPVVTCME